MKILITGAAGFTAKHLIELLSTESTPAELYLTSRAASPLVEAIPCDLGEESAVRNLICTIKPNQIYHLSGSFTNNYEADYHSNVLTSKYILDSIRNLKLNCRVLLIGSAAEYGLIAAADNPVPETHSLKPVSTYGLTKLFQTYLMDYYRRMYQLDVVMARPFNLSGKGMSNYLFIGKIYEQIAQYRQGRIKRIIVGNLDSRRDYIDVQEAVKAYRLIMNCGMPGEIYNVGSGRPIKIADLLNDILREHNLSMQAVECAQVNTSQPSKFDIPEIYADIRKLEALA